jgi:hypothetical protein
MAKHFLLRRPEWQDPDGRPLKEKSDKVPMDEWRRNKPAACYRGECGHKNHEQKKPD